MKKLAVLASLFLAGCDPGGAYPEVRCTARDTTTGYCTAATYTCDNIFLAGKYPMLTHWQYYGPRCK